MEQFFDNWEEKKKKIKQEHPQVKEDDLAYELGNEEALLERLQKRLNKNREELRSWLTWMG